MPESTLIAENRDDVLNAPNLFEYFCIRAATDFRSRGSDEAPAVSFAGILVTAMASFVLFVFGMSGLAKAMFMLFGLIVLWTVWGVVVRSSSRTGQKADDIRRGSFPADAAPFVMAKLRWWNHLVSPRRWAKHSRVFDRRNKLVRHAEELGQRLAAFQAGNAGAQESIAPIEEEETIALAASLNSFADRRAYEDGLSDLVAEGPERCRAELLLCRALLRKVDELTDNLERIEKLSVAFQGFTAGDLSQVVSEALQVLDERRALVLEVDQIDPDDFVDMVTVRAV